MDGLAGGAKMIVRDWIRDAVAATVAMVAVVVLVCLACTKKDIKKSQEKSANAMLFASVPIALLFLGFSISLSMRRR